MKGPGIRVVAGRFRGIRLETLAGRGIRPTADRVKEALFASLGPLAAGSRVVDCFAGTGALGIEALSRGAERVAFVEGDRRSLALLRRNLARVGAGESEVTVLSADALAAADWAPRALPADLILADPPYAADLGTPFLAALAAVEALREGGEVVLEHAASRSEPAYPAFALFWRRRYGDTVISRYRPA